MGGNIIKASDGGSTITLDTDDGVTLGGRLSLPQNISGSGKIRITAENNVEFKCDNNASTGDYFLWMDGTDAIRMSLEGDSGNLDAGGSILAGAGITGTGSLYMKTTTDGQGIKAENQASGAAFEAKWVSGGSNGYQLKMENW